MASLEDKGFTSQMQSSDINLNLITFPFKNSSRTIQWHKASFNDVIRVQNGDPVQWVIEFTIHTRDRYFPFLKWEFCTAPAVIIQNSD